MKITEDILYVGVNDHKIDLFEGQYHVPHGMSYNSYLILDEKVAVMDTVDQHFTKEWLTHLETALDGRKPDYLIVQHMEPDHAANIESFVEAYPEARVVGNEKTFRMMAQYFRKMDMDQRKYVVSDGETLRLGRHQLTFIFAPMVHWPEVMMSYDQTDQILFSADGFGKFGALDQEEDWEAEARRYYFGIVGKFGSAVQAVLKKLGDTPIQKIAPLHGPVLDKDLSYYVEKYVKWSNYEPESEGVLIAYSSVYGHTKQAACLLAEALKKEQCEEVMLYDLDRQDILSAVDKAFYFKHLVLACTTYNGGLFPHMKIFIDYLLERNYKDRTVGFIENGSWAPTAIRTMKKMMEGCKEIVYLENSVTIAASLSEENKKQLCAMAKELCEK